MKILILSVSPYVNTGYGLISKNLIDTLKELGHEVRLLAYYGNKYRDNYNGVDIYPTYGNSYGNQSCYAHCLTWKPDLFLTTFDLFVLDSDFLKRIKEMGIKTSSLLMVDASPYQNQNTQALQEVDYPIIVTRWAREQLPKDIRDRCTYIPLQLHQDYTPFDKKAAKLKYNEFMGGEILNEDSKLVTVVSANVGDQQNRKNFYAIIYGWQKYLEMNEDINTYLHLHTDVRGISSKGIDLKTMMMVAKYTGKQASTVIFPNQMAYLNNEITTQQLNTIYNASDIYLNPSQGEGFGLPVSESIASGCQPLVTDFGAAKEIVHNCYNSPSNYLLKGEPIYVGGQSTRINASPNTVAQGIDYLFKNPTPITDRLNASKKCIEEYGQEHNMELWEEFLKKVEL